MSMDDRVEDREGLTLLDGAGMVTGAAVASIHIRGVMPSMMPPVGWVLVWVAFAGVALTAAGPFVFLGRRFGRRTVGYPRVGDKLWAMWGIPWVLTALLRTSSPGIGPQRGDLVALGLSVGLGLASLVALAVVWKTWVLVPPEEVARGEPTPWTNRVGLVLSVAWPLQCGFGFFVIEAR
ncbi:MAG TPA: hypothetical protein VGZ22_08705 [Isosphaeraceae bacterium]|jgi:hypothetical protein|nr:hypothetical protein [Isosphaeraceae bacterium]